MLREYVSDIETRKIEGSCTGRRWDEKRHFRKAINHDENRVVIDAGV